MTIPYRGTTGDGIYFVTSSTFQKKAQLQSERMASLLIATLIEYRNRQKYEIHEFVVMPDHFHLLITPIVTLERAIQLIKRWLFISSWKIISRSREHLADKLL